MQGDPFSASVAEWVDRAKGRSLEVYQRTVADALARVKELTPVKTGYLRANWTVIRAGDAAPVAGSDIDSAEVIASLKLTDAAVITNPVVYARRIEYGFVGRDSLNRYYNQVGRGMMQQTIAELPQIAARAAAEVEAQQ